MDYLAMLSVVKSMNYVQEDHAEREPEDVSIDQDRWAQKILKKKIFIVRGLYSCLIWADVMSVHSKC